MVYTRYNLHIDSKFCASFSIYVDESDLSHGSCLVGCCFEVCGWAYVGSLSAVLRHPRNNHLQVKEIATSITRQIGCSTQILHSGIVGREKLTVGRNLKQM